MESKLLCSLRCLLLGTAALAAVSGAACAKEQWQVRRERIAGLHAQARQLRSEALRDYQAQMTECNKQIIATECSDQASQQRSARENEAVRIEKQAEALAQQVKDETRAAKEAAKVERARHRGLYVGEEEAKGPGGKLETK